mgnify:CR=1 FL=1
MMNMEKNLSEYDIQCQIVSFLRENLRPECMLTSFPLGGGGLKRGIKLKRSGCVAGWPDLQILHNGLYFGLEIKTERGKVSEAQKVIHRQLRKQGARVAVVKSILETKKKINDWNLLR